MRRRERKTSQEKSSGNVFADVGLPEKLLAKAKLVAEIHRIIVERGANQEDAANILGIDQPRVSSLLRGKLNLFSLERIMELLARLGNSVEIHVSESSAPSLSVVVSGAPVAYGPGVYQIVDQTGTSFAAFDLVSTPEVAIHETARNATLQQYCGAALNNNAAGRFLGSQSQEMYAG